MNSHSDVITDRLAIAQAMRDTTEPGPVAPIRHDNEVRCVQYSGGWAVMRGREVLGSHPSLCLAIHHQIAAEDRQ